MKNIKSNNLVLHYLDIRLSEKLQKTAQSTGFRGRHVEVKTANGKSYLTALALVDIDSIQASHSETGAENKLYPQELQPRDRSRHSSIAWVQKTAQNIDYDSLGRSRRADTGAPIVGEDMAVESGNGRTMALKLAYAQGKAEQYKHDLLEDAEYLGFSRSEVLAIQKPVLVRIRTSSNMRERIEFAIAANQDDKLSQTATERALSDAKWLDDHVVSLFSPSENGDFMAASNHKFLAAFLAKLGDTEAAQYLDKNGYFTQAFVVRVRQALFAKAYDDERLLEMMADQTKPDLQNMINALAVSAVKFIEAKSLSVVSQAQVEDVSANIVDGMQASMNDELMAAINEASDAIVSAQRQGQDVGEFLKQQGLFGDLSEGVAEIALFVSQNSRSVKKMAKFFGALAKYIEKNEIEGQSFGLFGEPQPVSVADAVGFALSEVDTVGTR
ncbi:hypothetical protein [Acinetobacter baretiae]|uniref:hypothetical protein n=1 Tax=Acinetobacter baretiae TaxID=2605383 RepID=UPI001BB36C27|nr:hypothetical protein [Acinetobacter baretiae]